MRQTEAVHVRDRERERDRQIERDRERERERMQQGVQSPHLVQQHAAHKREKRDATEREERGRENDSGVGHTCRSEEWRDQGSEAHVHAFFFL